MPALHPARAIVTRRPIPPASTRSAAGRPHVRRNASAAAGRRLLLAEERADMRRARRTRNARRRSRITGRLSVEERGPAACRRRSTPRILDVDRAQDAASGRGSRSGCAPLSGRIGPSAGRHRRRFPAPPRNGWPDEDLRGDGRAPLSGASAVGARRKGAHRAGSKRHPLGFMHWVGRRLAWSAIWRKPCAGRKRCFCIQVVAVL